MIFIDIPLSCDQNPNLIVKSITFITHPQAYFSWFRSHNPETQRVTPRKTNGALAPVSRDPSTRTKPGSIGE
jgi:hypothetical protein